MTTTSDPFMHARRKGYPIPTRIDGTDKPPAENRARECCTCHRAVPYGVIMSQRMCPPCAHAFFTH